LDDLEEKIQWKRQKEQEKDVMRKKVLRDQYQQHISKLQKDVKEYQDRWHQTGGFYHDPFDMLSENDIEKRIKRSLRVQDQNDNMKRILNQQK